MDMERKSLAFEAKMIDDGTGGFEGLGGCFANIDDVGDIIAPGAFKDAIGKFLADGFIGGLGHNWNVPIGHPVEAKETPEGLWVRAVFHDTPEAQAVRAMMKVHPESGRATVRKLSIGYGVPRDGSSRLKGAGEVKAYWKSIGYTPSREDEAMAAALPSVRLLKALHLHEISPVVVPANRRATVAGAKFLDGGPETRPSFKEQSRDVVSAIGGYLSRVESRLEARVKAGRELSATNWTEMDDVCTTLESGMGKLRAILDRTKPPAKSDATTTTGAGDFVVLAPPDASAKAERVDPAVALACQTRHMEFRHLALQGEVAGGTI